MSIYVVEFKGDLPRTRGLDAPYASHSLEVIMQYLTDLFVKKSDDLDDYCGISREFLPDPEDDRILVWEIIIPENHVEHTPVLGKVVAHFSGWHWDFNVEDLPGGPLPQMTLPGIPDGESLYSLASHD